VCVRECVVESEGGEGQIQIQHLWESDEMMWKRE
jgi:hypothetical protein